MEKKSNINSKIRKLEESLEFIKKKIIYHENSHLLFSYLFGFTVKYVDYTIISNISLKSSSIEMVFDSNAHAYIDIPIFLSEYFNHLRYVGTSDSFMKKINVPKDIIDNMTVAYITGLLAGYEAERHFFNRLKYWRIKRFIKKFSQDYTLKNIMEDETKVEEILKSLNFNKNEITEIRKVTLYKIRLALKNKSLTHLFHLFFELSQKNTRLSQEQIESLLAENNFEKTSQSILENINSKCK